MFTEAIQYQSFCLCFHLPISTLTYSAIKLRATEFLHVTSRNIVAVFVARRAQVICVIFLFNLLDLLNFIPTSRCSIKTSEAY